MQHDKISIESRILILLCSCLIAKDSGQSATPFTPVAWHKIKESIPDDDLPSLFELSSDKIAEKFNLQTDDSVRIESLLKRGGNLALELEQLMQKGIWVLTEFDDDYPSRFKNKLGHNAPPVIFGAGDISLLEDGGVAIVGSRDVDEIGKTFTENLAEQCADNDINVISGFAKGVDRIAMSFAFQGGGKVVGVLADSLTRFLSASEVRESVIDGNTTAITHLNPSAGFTVAGAMWRNKLIYALADYAVVVSSAHNSGGTWAGATEALRHKFAPVFVRDSNNVPDGNKELIKKGAIPIPENLDDFDLHEFFENHKLSDTGSGDDDKTSENLSKNSTLKPDESIQQTLDFSDTIDKK